jgi:hypothetical protein
MKRCILNRAAPHFNVAKGTSSSRAQEQSITAKPFSFTICWSSLEMHLFPIGLQKFIMFQGNSILKMKRQTKRIHVLNEQ